MDFWLWLVLGLVVAVGGASFWLRGLRRRNAESFSAALTPERARAASARLNETQHREVYRFLAADNVLSAAQAIKLATGAGVRESLLDAQALRSFPQVWVAPSPAAEQGLASAADAADTATSGTQPLAEGPAAGTPAAPSSRGDQDPEPKAPAVSPNEPQTPAAAPQGEAAEAGEWVIPEHWADEYGGENTSELNMELTRLDGDELRRFSTLELPAAERDQFMSQLRDGDFSEAAGLIAERMGADAASVEEALRANLESGPERVQGISLRFDLGNGQQVDFSTQALPEDERESFFAALRAGDLVAAAQLVSRHTGISPEQALGMLESFRHHRGR
ncbi:cytochrome c-type biogenesis protein [Galactobacter valiniphilus]|uniref:hypothetical protein n=1 Tax=Galactobacter valiniphilus TaxID=2676122 RepID=UPI0037364245